MGWLQAGELLVQMIKSESIITLSRIYLTVFFDIVWTEQLSHQLQEAPGLQGWRACAQVEVGCLQNQNSSVTLFCLRSSFENEWEGKNGETGGGGVLRINVSTLM